MGIDLLSERARRVASVAQRLRVVQAELADHPADERRAMMRDEIELVLRSMVPGERKQFLFELMDAFPLFGEGSSAPAGGSEGPGPDRATMDALAAAQAELAAAKSELSRFNDAAYVTERLVELAKRLPDEQRRAVIKRLATAGLSEVRTVEVAKAESAPVAPRLAAPAPAPVAAPTAPAPANIAADFRKATGLTDADPIDSSKAAELGAVLAEFGGGLDELVWTAWRQVIAPQSRISRPGPLKRTLGQFVRGDATVSRQRVIDDVKLLRLITAATIAATSRAGKNFARKHLVKFSPDAIKAATGASGWGAQAKYWAKYEELAGVLTEDTIEAEIMQTIGEAARGLAEGKESSKP
ncbi:MAG: hypothetical protein HEQ23_00805 [Tepidisphaera sp.]